MKKLAIIAFLVIVLVACAPVLPPQVNETMEEPTNETMEEPVDEPEGTEEEPEETEEPEVDTRDLPVKKLLKET